MKKVLTVAAMFASSTSLAYAQTVEPTPLAPAAPSTAPVQPQVAIPPAQTTNAVLRAGTEIALAMSEEITTKKKAARVGQRFQLRVVAPVEVNGVEVIPAGSPAWGEITSVRNKGMWGKSGKLEARLLYVRVNGRQIRLTGNFDDKGVTGTAGVVGAIAFVPLAGFLMTGTSAVFPMDGAVKGFIDEDVPLAMAATPVAPMAVGEPAAPMVVTEPSAAADVEAEAATDD